MRRATNTADKEARKRLISIHALLAESDQLYDTYAKVLRVFLSTLSLRRATHNTKNNCIDYYISIHALLAESDFANFEGFFWWVISIHALLAESDAADISARREASISIHALLAESDGGSGVGNLLHVIFLSTLSLRRATVMDNIVFVPGKFLSTLSLRRATQIFFDTSGATYHFYPRSPCGERQSIM